MYSKSMASGMQLMTYVEVLCHIFGATNYRWREHCGQGYDNDIGYRTELEFESWKQKDPIKLLGSILILIKLRIYARNNQ